MNRPDPGWDLYRSFLAVLQEGSLSGAARRLGLTQPTLARHVDELEAALGLDLFVRTQRGLAATDAARDLAPHAETIAASAAALLRAASGGREVIAGTVRITASDVVGVELLPPILADLRACHPGLTIELALSDAVEDLLRREADIAVRMVAPAQAALVARRIGRIGLGLHARRDYLDRAGTPVAMADLVGHSLIAYDRETPAIRALLARVPALAHVAPALRADSNLAQLAAVRAGFGIGICQNAIARRDPALVRLLAAEFDLGLDTWVVMHENLRSNPRCRTVFDALADGLGRHVDA